jgi:hypothetical protein
VEGGESQLPSSYHRDSARPHSLASITCVLQYTVSTHLIHTCHSVSSLVGYMNNSSTLGTPFPGTVPVWVSPPSHQLPQTGGDFCERTNRSGPACQELLYLLMCIFSTLDSPIPISEGYGYKVVQAIVFPAHKRTRYQLPLGM